MEIRDLEYMNDDPHSVDVLYAKVSLKDKSDRLVSVIVNGNDCLIVFMYELPRLFIKIQPASKLSS
jgi:hypothetical protein